MSIQSLERELKNMSVRIDLLEKKTREIDSDLLLCRKELNESRKGITADVTFEFKKRHSQAMLFMGVMFFVNTAQMFIQNPENMGHFLKLAISIFK